MVGKCEIAKKVSTTLIVGVACHIWIPKSFDEIDNGDDEKHISLIMIVNKSGIFVIVVISLAKLCISVVKF